MLYSERQAILANATQEAQHLFVLLVGGGIVILLLWTLIYLCSKPAKRKKERDARQEN